MISVYLFPVLCIERIGYKLQFHCLYGAQTYMIVFIN